MNGESGRNCNWRVIPYHDAPLTDDHRDYIRLETMSADTLRCELSYGNLPDGLFIANTDTRQVYRVTGGKLMPAFKLG